LDLVSFGVFSLATRFRPIALANPKEQLQQ
jgi:hypothetical protein